MIEPQRPPPLLTARSRAMLATNSDPWHLMGTETESLLNSQDGHNGHVLRILQLEVWD